MCVMRSTSHVTRSTSDDQRKTPSSSRAPTLNYNLRGDTPCRHPSTTSEVDPSLLGLIIHQALGPACGGIESKCTAASKAAPLYWIVSIRVCSSTRSGFQEEAPRVSRLLVH
eukprot:1195443-Prorocentrum_minimum.AAC.1